MDKHQAIRSTSLFLFINGQSPCGITWRHENIGVSADRPGTKSALGHLQAGEWSSELSPTRPSFPPSSKGQLWINIQHNHILTTQK